MFSYYLSLHEFLCVYLVGVHRLLDSVGLGLLPLWEFLSHYFSKYIFSPTLFSPSETLMRQMKDFFFYCPYCPGNSVLFFLSLLLMCWSDWVNFIELLLSSLILSSAISTLPWAHQVSFLSSYYCIFQFYNFHLVFFKIFSLSLLWFYFFYLF